MSLNLKVVSLLFVFLVIFVIIYMVRKEKISIKYSLIWMFSNTLLLLAIIIPGFLEFITNLLGFKIASNMIFAFIISVLMIITISLTIIVSRQNEKIKILIQELSILKSRCERGSKK